jgi:hypothetical protein
LDKYCCKRLTDDESNKERVMSFRNEKNQSLVEYLQEYAWDDDLSGNNAVYVVLDTSNNNDTVLYFALKCGMISCPFTSDIYKLLDEKNEEIIASMPSDKVETLNYIKKFIYESEKNADVDKVAETLPGIELSQFCLNLAYRRERKLEGIDTKGLGAYFFHKEIFTIVSKVKSYVGCQFLYLFAADSSENQSLVSYYRDILGFTGLNEYDGSLTDDRDVIPIMPYYDYQCKFMLMPL